MILSPPKKRPKKSLTEAEKQSILNIFKAYDKTADKTMEEKVEFTANAAGNFCFSQ